MYEIYDREAELRNRLNSFFVDGLGLEASDYYERLDLDNFLKFKSVLSDINNIFTMKVSLAFVHWITDRLKLSYDATEAMVSSIIGTKPNSNGFDIEVSDPIKVIAEVKCNIPINSGTVYGSAQRNGIAKDIEALTRGKSKSGVDPNSYLKFMVFLDQPEIRQATQHFAKNFKGNSQLITFIEKDTQLTANDKIYVVFVNL